MSIVEYFVLITNNTISIVAGMQLNPIPNLANAKVKLISH